MTLISLLLVLMLELFFRISAILEDALKYHKWFPNWFKWLRARIKQSWFDDWPGIIIILGIPLVLLHLLYPAENGFLLQLFQLALSVVILVYCLGPIEQNKHLKEYFLAVENGDLQSAYHHVEDYLDLKSGKYVPEDLSKLGRVVTRLILSQSNFRFFGVLVYFVLLGPVGALMYRLACTFEFTIRDDEKSPYQEKLNLLRKILDWLPSRITGFLYALAGDFTGAMVKLKKYLLIKNSDPDKLIQETGLGALGIKTENFQENSAEIIEENKQAQSLISRSMVIFLVIIAIMTVYGWPS